MQNQTVNDCMVYSDYSTAWAAAVAFPIPLMKPWSRACRQNWIAFSGSHFTQTLSTILFLDGLKRKRNQ